jgi:chaperonin GroES
MQIRPLYDRIIVKRVDIQRKTASGIVIPDTAAEKPEQGEIVAVGSGRLLQDGSVVPLQVQTGQQILFAKYGGQAIKLNGEEFLVMREEDVLGIFEDNTGALKKAA